MGHVRPAAALRVARAVRGMASRLVLRRLRREPHHDRAGARLAKRRSTAPWGGAHPGRGVRGRSWRDRTVAADVAVPADAVDLRAGAPAGADILRAFAVAGGDRSRVVPSGLAVARSCGGPRDGPFRILVTCGRAAGCLWLAHLLRATLLADRTGGTLAWTLTAAWTLAITLVVFAIAAAVLSAIAALAECTSAPRASEYWLIVLIAAVGVEEIFRRIVFPSLALGARESAAVAALLGLTVAAMWSGFVVRVACRRRVKRPRRASCSSRRSGTGRQRAPALAALLAVSFVALHFFERLDWDFVVQRLILAAEWIAVFGLMLRTTDRTRERTWASPARAGRDPRSRSRLSGSAARRIGACRVDAPSQPRAVGRVRPLRGDRERLPPDRRRPRRPSRLRYGLLSLPPARRRFLRRGLDHHPDGRLSRVLVARPPARYFPVRHRQPAARLRVGRSTPR